jgi:AcrR family transcriptional regulator
MPLPRFDRLDVATRAGILAVARAHFARDGRDGASFNRIIADAGISKTSAYHYFDGKDDLFRAVVADAEHRMADLLGPWQEVGAAGPLWSQIVAGSARLAAHLREHPDDRAVLTAERPGAMPGPWITQLVGNGLRIGVIDPAFDLDLVTGATAAVISAVDGWALARPTLPDDVVADALRDLLTRLWVHRT